MGNLSNRPEMNTDPLEYESAGFRACRLFVVSSQAEAEKVEHAKVDPAALLYLPAAASLAAAASAACALCACALSTRASSAAVALAALSAAAAASLSALPSLAAAAPG